MIDCTIKPIDPDAPGSWNELTRAYKILNSGDFNEIEKLVMEIIANHSDSQDIEKTMSKLSISDLKLVIESRFASANNINPL